LTPAALQGYGVLNDIALPSDAFDPSGWWRHVYRIWSASVRPNQYGGFLAIERTPAKDGRSVVLGVERSILQSSLTIHRTKATIKCAADALCTPLSWEMESMLIGRDGEPIDVTRVAEMAVVRNKSIEVKTSRGIFHRKLPGRFTSDFSLFDAVQRLPGKDTAPIAFTLLQDLELVKPGQRLWYSNKTVGVKVGGKSVRLHGYHQVGRGILPCEYWLDDRKHLILVMGTIMAYVFDPQAEHSMQTVIEDGLQREEQIRKWIQKKLKKQ
jgi:hypothetical protein